MDVDIKLFYETIVPTFNLYGWPNLKDTLSFWGNRVEILVRGTKYARVLFLGTKHKRDLKQSVTNQIHGKSMDLFIYLGKINSN